MVTKVFIAGKTGMVGSALVRLYDSKNDFQVIAPTRSELDLTNRDSVFSFIAGANPDLIIDAAARVGGIVENNSFPVDFLSTNLQIQSNLMDAAAAKKVKKFIFLGSSCIYPKLASQPMKEDALLTGALEETNSAYAVAKIAGLKLIQAYRQQFDFKWNSAMPTNLYGPNDNFDFKSSHVIPGLIAKFHNAKESNAKSITLWGTGSALREFLHVDDLAQAVDFIYHNYDDDDFINIGSGQELSIKDLALMIQELVGFKGELIWDANYPDGTPRKLLDSSKISALGWKPKISLSEGIAATYQWYLANH